MWCSLHQTILDTTTHVIWSAPMHVHYENVYIIRYTNWKGMHSFARYSRQQSTSWAQAGCVSNSWKRKPTQTYQILPVIIKTNATAMWGRERHESRLLWFVAEGFWGDSGIETLLCARCGSRPAILRYLCIDISLTKEMQAKRRTPAITRLAWTRWSAGSSIEKNMRSSTPRALTRSCVRASKKKNHSSGSQVFCQAVTTRMAAKFAVVRAGRYYEVGIDSYTPLMVAWHRSEPICMYVCTYVCVTALRM
jgi:hypothetical protein